MVCTHGSLKSSAFCISTIMYGVAFLSVCTAIAADASAESLPALESPKIVQPTCMRAILHHKDNQETLILSLDFIDAGTADVNGVFDSWSKEVAWVLPIPGDTLEMRESSPIPLRMLMPITGPYKLNGRITDLLFVPFFLTTIALIGWCCTGRQIHKRIWMKTILMGLILVSVVVSIILLRAPRFDLLSEMGLYTSEPMESSMTEPPKTVILRPQSQEEFREILAREHHLEMMASNLSLAAEYIDQGWAFALIRMVIPMCESPNSSPFRTPSVAFTFSTETPILPLPLFGARHDSLQTDIVVIGETSFRNGALRLESIFRSDETPYTVAQLHNENVPPTRLGACSTYVLEGLPNLRIGFPAITNLLWDGCVLTRFSGEIRPSKDANEIRLHAEPASSSFRVTFGHPRAILVKRMFYASLVGLIWMTGIFLLVIFSKISDHKALLTALILCTFPISLGMGIACCSQVESLDEDEKIVPWQRNPPTDNLDLLVKELSGKPELTGENAYQGIGVEVQDVLEQAFPPLDGEEDWYRLFEDDRGLICRVYDVRDDIPFEPMRLEHIALYSRLPPRAKHPVWPVPDSSVTFLGEPTDIVLVKKSSPD